MVSWKKDKLAADVFMPTIKAIMGRAFVVEGSIKEDQEQATDLRVLRLNPITMAVRMRRKHYIEKYPDDVTIRASRPSGVPTEWDKIMSGWASHFFYGFGDFDTGKLISYAILDLELLRVQYCRDPKSIKSSNLPNQDGSSGFRAIKLSSLDDGVIAHRYVMSR